MSQANLYIDTSLHVSSLPTTYVPPGFLIAVSATIGDPAGGVTAANASTYELIGNCALNSTADVLSGFFTMGTATFAVVIPVGFSPTKVRIVDWTNYAEYEWLLGAPSTKTLKSSASSTYNSVAAGSVITVTADAAGGLGDVCYVTLAASTFTAADVISFRIEA